MDVRPKISELGLHESLSRLTTSLEIEASEKVVSFYFGEGTGQCRSDTKVRYHDMAGIKLGHSGPPLASEKDLEGKAIEMNEIHIGREYLNRTYTILDRSYVAFLAEVFRYQLGERCWFLPSKRLHRPAVYEGILEAALLLTAHVWSELYEFTICAPDLSWMADYNHHHSIIVYGDQPAGRAQFLCSKRRKWKDKVLSCNFYPKTQSTKE